MELPLSALGLDERAYISRVSGQPDMVRRLRELGFLPGTGVCCELISPAGSPVAYRVRGALIALRRRDADMVTVASDREREE